MNTSKKFQKKDNTYIQEYIFNIDSSFRDKDEWEDPGEFSVPLPFKLKNVSYVELTSIEFPNTFYQISTDRESNYFKITHNSIVHRIEIPSGNYDSTSLLTSITDQFTIINDATTANISISIDSITGKTTITSDENISLNFNNGNTYKSLGCILGYSEDSYDNATSFIGTKVVSIFSDNYIFIDINGYGSVSSANSNVRNTMAKVVLTSNKYTIAFDGRNEFVTKIHYFHKLRNIINIKVKVLDYLGNVINMEGCDFSFTLELGVVLDPQLYQEINNNEFGYRGSYNNMMMQ